MQNILITGGAGFIGTHLCRKLIQKGHSVKVLDLKTPTQPIPQVTYIQGDIRDSETVLQCLQNIDVVFHFAAIVSVPVCQNNPVESHQTNLMGTMILLDAIHKTQTLHGKPIRIVFASSAAVYGHDGQNGIPLSESLPTAQPISFYAAQKLGSEHLFRLYAEKARIPSLIFRFFNVFGPGQDPSSPYSGVISIFTSHVKAKKPLTLFGDGSQTRDFISVHDIVSACALSLSLPENQFNAQILNLGSGETTTITQLADFVMSISNQTVPMNHVDPREGDVKHSLANIQKATTILNWAPTTSLRQGLAEVTFDPILG